MYAVKFQRIRVGDKIVNIPVNAIPAPNVVTPPYFSAMKAPKTEAA